MTGSGSGAGGLAAGGGAHALGAVSAEAGEGARGVGGPEQAGVVGALRASRLAAGAPGERLPWGAGGCFRLWRELGGGVREIGGAELEDRLRWERVLLEKAHFEAVRGIEREAGAAYRDGMKGSQERAELAARTGGMSAHYDPPVDWYRLKHSMLEERMEQVREIDGEQAYEKMRRAVEKASQVERASQVEKASQPLQPSQYRSRDRPERGGPERGGPERDFGPSR